MEEKAITFGRSYTIFREDSSLRRAYNRYMCGFNQDKNVGYNELDIVGWI